jgi:hypothetical protein
MEVRLPLDLLIEIALLLIAVGGVWALMRAELKELRRQVEDHGPDVRKISPLETRLNSFEDEVQRRLGGIERKVDEVHTLLLRAAARA